MGGMKYGKIVIGLWLLVFGYFVWWGAINPIWEGDSLAYHVPIAQMIAEGKWMDRDSYKLPFYYYPAMGETLLSGWIKLGLPANWYNLLGWIILSGTVYGLGRRTGIKKEAAIITAAAVSTWPSVVRLIPTQTVDIWVAVFWIGTVLQIMKRDWLWAGIFLGMLVGTKYSGILFALILITVFWPKLKNNILAWLLPLVIIGGFWYVRNWLLVGNPVYPLDVLWLGWAGIPDLVLFTGKPIITLFSAPLSVIEALLSEYLVWAGLLLLPLAVRSKWVFLGWINFMVYLFLPSRPENIISDLRYIYPVMIPLLIAARKWFDDRGRGEIFTMAVVLAMVAEMTQLDYHPKLFVIVILITCLVIFNQFIKSKLDK
jgi:hypothetical protein